MSISQLGNLNTTALVVADVYVQIVPPQFLLNGVPSNIVGYVGTACWGPVNTPVIVGSPAEYGVKFGRPQARTYDMGTHVAIGFQQDMRAAKCIRVTDGSDVAASAVIQTNCLTVTSKWTGSYGNQTKISISTGAVPNSKLVRVFMPGLVPELFNNILQGVKSVAVSAGGTGYTSAPTVTFSDPPAGFGNRRTALGHVVLTAGAVTSIVIDDPGDGYTSAPTVSLSGGGGSGATLGTPVISYWPSIAYAINNGAPNQRSASELVTATAGSGTTAPAAASYTLNGGTDGVNAITSALMVGVDTVPRTGMYAMRGQDIAVATLCDLTDNSTWPTQDAFGQGEGIYMVTSGPSGESISTARSNKDGAGADTYALKVLLGDWAYWNDSYNGIAQRLVSPCAFAVGMLGALAPQHSTLNKRLSGINGTEKSKTGLPYTSADLQELALGGIDVIANPSPGGRYFGFRNGHNSSSNAVIHGDNYTRMTNYIAATLNRGMGIYVGQLQSRRPDDETRRRAKATLDAFLTAMRQQGQIDDFQVVLDKSNNPDQRIALGYMQADVKVVYMAVVEFFVINLEGGQSVEIVRQSTQQLAAAA